MMIFKRSFTTACALIWCSFILTALGAQATSFPLATAPLATSVASQTCNDGEVIDVMVVGSGLTGGTAAYYLNKKGINVLLTDAREEAGGNLITKQGKLLPVPCHTSTSHLMLLHTSSCS